MTQLAQGVHLHVIPTEKYKTISIKLKFKSPLKRNDLVKRALVASLLETNSMDYPSQTLMQEELSNLYGAQLGAGVSSKGDVHILSLAMNMVNDRYLKESSVLERGISFLQSVLTKPNVQDERFDSKTFDRQVQNLKDDFESIYDDKQSYAQLALKELYFTDSAHQVTSSGHLNDLKNLKNEDVYQTYLKMLNEDQIDIFVLGNVDEKRIRDLFKDFKFSDRQEIKNQVFYHNKKETFQSEVEDQEVTQAKYHLAYDTGLYYQDDNYFAGQVFNGLFGGFPHSKLFMNVREKESLAYYSSSKLDSFNGVMYVTSGIDWKQAPKVLEIINLQLKDMQDGQFDDLAFNQTKELIKNGLLQSEDSANATIERLYGLSLVGKDLTIDQWIKKIDQVTKEDVIQVAQNITLKASFLLKGVTKDAE